LERHQGRALRRLGRRDEARERLERALRFFQDSGEAYNTARTLADLAETHAVGAESTAALPLVDAAIAALGRENAAYHLAHLRMLRGRCVSVA
jgi:tetratricopeptide (TPR) repeat protein